MSYSLTRLPNLGPASARLLREARIVDEETLRDLDAVDAFFKVKESGATPSLNLLYALYGALTNQKWDQLSLETRARLDYEANFRAGG